MRHNYDFNNFNEFVNAIQTDTSAYDYVLTTLTSIQDKVVTQKFYNVNIPSYVDVEAGRGAFNQKILHNVVYDLAGNFETGFINTGDGVRLEKTDIGIDKLEFPIQNWAKGCRYSYIDVQQCFVANNFDLVEQLIQSRKRNWDLGLQQTIFVGCKNNPAITGLANNANVTSNTTTLTKKISAMTTAELTAFVSVVLADYYNNTNKTQAPNLFIIPTDDYLGLTAPASDYQPQYSKLQLLEDAFRTAVARFGVPSFQILPLAYLNKTEMNALTGVNKYRYILTNKNPDTYYAPIPVEFTMTQFGTRDNFNFENVAYGQVAGTVILRPQEVLYFDFA